MTEAASTVVNETRLAEGTIKGAPDPPVFRAISGAIESLARSRGKALELALVATSASSTRRRIGVSSWRDSVSRSTGGPLCGGGRFVSDGGTMISTTSL